MILSVKNGNYRLYETKNNNKVLELDNEKYIWLLVPKIGEMLVITALSHQLKNVISAGNYRLYRVKDEPDLTDLLHLEFFVGNGSWQGYLLPTGLPLISKKRSRIIPTSEIIAKSTV